MKLELVTNNYSKVAHIPDGDHWGWRERKTVCKMDTLGSFFSKSKDRRTCSHCERIVEARRRP